MSLQRDLRIHSRLKSAKHHHRQAVVPQQQYASPLRNHIGPNGIPPKIKCNSEIYKKSTSRPIVNASVNASEYHQYS